MRGDRLCAGTFKTCTLTWQLRARKRRARVTTIPAPHPHAHIGELYDQIRVKRSLPEDTARAYAAEIFDTLCYLRERGVVHRDLKPENLLLSGEGHLKLIDFGSAKLLPGGGVARADPALLELFAPRGAEERAARGRGTPSPVDGRRPPVAPAPHLQLAEERRAVSLVGTADYVSPEVLENRDVTCASDLWALGCVLFQMLAGAAPFKAGSEYLTFQRILARDFQLPPHVSPAAADAIERLLHPDPMQRLGARDPEEFRRHPLFEGVRWDALWTQPGPSFVEMDLESLGSVTSSFDWELQVWGGGVVHGWADSTCALLFVCLVFSSPPSFLHAQSLSMGPSMGSSSLPEISRSRGSNMDHEGEQAA